LPHPLELPRMSRPVVPLVRSRHTVIRKLVPPRLPRLAAVVRTLNHLPKPSAGLRRIQPFRIHRRSLDVINLPPRKVRPAHIPLLPLPIRRQHKCSLARANQQSHLAHRSSSPVFFPSNLPGGGPISHASQCIIKTRAKSLSPPTVPQTN